MQISNEGALCFIWTLTNLANDERDLWSWMSMSEIQLEIDFSTDGIIANGFKFIVECHANFSYNIIITGSKTDQEEQLNKIDIEF